VAALNEARLAFSYLPFAYSSPPATGGTIQASHITELRQALR
jgi:hypothetical protein